MKSALIRFLLAWAALSCAAIGAAYAQQYPTRPIRIVVGFPPGGATDIGARLVAQKLTTALGQTVLVDNRPGAGSNIAAEHVAKAPPDGYTIYWITSNNSISEAWFSKLGYNIRQDFAPISQFTSMSHVVVVHPSLPVSSVKELVAFAKSQPGKLDYSTSGAGGSPHLAGEWFKTMARCSDDDRIRFSRLRGYCVARHGFSGPHAQ
jgi:tripartite-type tricarboxylate transporter receptor subunit TctC